jgi:hypothetical protein
MPTVAIDTDDAGELVEMLAFIDEWLTHDPELKTSLAEFVGHPAYGIQHLHDDLQRFVFLLGGDDEGRFLVGHNP